MALLRNFIETGRPWYEGTVWLLYSVLGLAITAGVGGIAGAATDKLKIGDFTDGGQFAVYTAGMLIGTEYLLKKPHSLRLPWSEWFGLVTLPCLLLSAAFVVLATLSLNGEDIDKSIYRVPSVIVFFLSLVVAYIAVVFDIRRTTLDPLRARQEELDKLGRSFDSMDVDNSK